MNAKIVLSPEMILALAFFLALAIRTAPGMGLTF
jgi:hypothetical protein